MKVSDVMSANVSTCSPSDSLRDVAKAMRDKDCGAIPVVESGNLRGIITDRDIVVRGLAEGRNVMDLDAASCMTPHVATISKDAKLDECLDLMEKEQIRRVVVTGKNDEIVGIVAQADIALNAPRKETGDAVKKISE